MVMTALDRRWDRLLKRVEELRTWRNALELPIEPWAFRSDSAEASLQIGEFWPVDELPVQLAASATIPPEWAGLPVELELWLGGEGHVRISTGIESGLNAPHHRFPVLDRAAGGETVTIEAEIVPKGMMGGHIDEPRIERAHLVIPQPDVYGLERDASMVLMAARELEQHEVAPFLIDALDAGFSELARDWPSATPTAVTRYAKGLQHAIRSGVAAIPADFAQAALDVRWINHPLWHLPPAPASLAPLSPE